jgi:hypothetical protein
VKRRQVPSLQVESRRALVPARPRVVRRCNFASFLLPPSVGFNVRPRVLAPLTLRCAPARPPSVCSLRFAPVRARGDTGAGLKQVALFASGARGGCIVGMTL